MVDRSRVDKTFYKHWKVQKARSADPGSISLWLLANCFCRDHRRQGRLTHEEALELGSLSEIRALVDARLWREIDGGYEFNDWLEWNPDFVGSGPRSSPGRIVFNVLGDHPEQTRLRLAQEVEKLVDENVCLSVIEAALRKWGKRPDAKPSWLPYLVSDAIREADNGLEAAIRDARRTGKMSGLARFGYRWTAPDIPDDCRSKRSWQEFKRRDQMAWLDTIEASIHESTA